MKLRSFDQMLKQHYAAVLAGSPIFSSFTGSSFAPYGHAPSPQRVVAAKRNDQGHLLCQGPCGEPYPYAEPSETGPFVCFGCRSGT